MVTTIAINVEIGDTVDVRDIGPCRVHDVEVHDRGNGVADGKVRFTFEYDGKTFKKTFKHDKLVSVKRG